MQKLSVIIPCYNEERTVELLIDKVINAKTPLQEKELVLIDDCSSDGTLAILTGIQKKAAPPNVSFKLLQHEKNMGKGAAIRTGIKNCSGDIVIIQDADLEYDPSEFYDLIIPIIDNKADVVYGTRFPQPLTLKNFSLHVFGNKALTFLSNIFSGLKLTDMETCYKVFRAEVIKELNLRSNRFGFEPEVTAKIAKKGSTIIEKPVSYKSRTYAEGKKIGIKDAIDAAWCIIRYNVFN